MIRGSRGSVRKRFGLELFATNLWTNGGVRYAVQQSSQTSKARSPQMSVYATRFSSSLLFEKLHPADVSGYDGKKE